MTKIKLLYIFSGTRDFNHIRNYPYTEFYGYDKFIKDPNFEVNFLQIHQKGMLWLLWRPFELYLCLKTGVGFKLDKVLANLKLINSQDIVLAVNDSAGLPLVLLKKLRIIKPKIAFISAGLINNLEIHQKHWVFKFYSWFLKKADLILCWSPFEENLFKSLIKVKAKFILLESDLDFYKPDYNKPLGNFVLSIGRDIGRDYKSLFKALQDLKIPAKIIANPNHVKNLKVPDNIELYTKRVEFPILINWYKKAKLVIINLKENHRFSGQRALLEALALGKATITAETKALTSTYNLKDNQEIIFYKPGDINDLKDKINLIYNNPDKIRNLGKQARMFAENLPKNSFFQILKKFLLEL